MEHEVYLGLGGNIGDTPAILKSVLKHIVKLNISNLKISHFYETKPISDIDQRWYVNAACCFNTTMKAKELLSELQKIECMHGKIPKPKNEPRTIDIDILFFGNERWEEDDCHIPHPRWKERLFVIKPLLDLTEIITIPGNNKAVAERVNLVELIQSFHDQTICKLLI